MFSELKMDWKLKMISELKWTHNSLVLGMYSGSDGL